MRTAGKFPRGCKKGEHVNMVCIKFRTQMRASRQKIDAPGSPGQEVCFSAVFKKSQRVLLPYCGCCH